MLYFHLVSPSVVLVGLMLLLQGEHYGVKIVYFKFLYFYNFYLVFALLLFCLLCMFLFLFFIIILSMRLGYCIST
jgi:hypothetical protein